MRLKTSTCFGLALAGLATTVGAHTDHSHSLEADTFEERLEGPAARARAAERIRWRDPAGRRDPRVEVKLLGINDFHGQLSARAVGARPAGGAAVLASYIRQCGGGQGRLHHSCRRSRRRLAAELGAAAG